MSTRTLLGLSTLAFTLSVATAASVFAAANYPFPPGSSGNRMAPPSASSGEHRQPPDEAIKTLGGGCAVVRSIHDWKTVDDYRIIVKSGTTKRFLVTFNSPCREARYKVGFQVWRNFGMCLSAGDQITFTTSPFGSTRYDMDTGMSCFVSRVERIESPLASR